MTAKRKGLKEKISGKSPYQRQPTVAIVVRRTPLDKTLLCSSSIKRKLKTAVPSSPARSRAAQRIVETDLFADKTMMRSESLRPA
jgi:hypothetical protein